jgi:ectoine hydroxylase-related dioxygenase (phytanoyl-CoA dioxygenase family)
MVLTEEQIEHFYREGYVLVPGLIPVEAVEEVLKYAPTELNSNGFWEPRIFDHKNPMKDFPLHQLLVHENIEGAVQEIFGSAPRVYYGMLAGVPAHGGNGLPWHQDNQYHQVLGGALNVFIALTPITPEKAGLWVAPRSHLKGVQPSKINNTTTNGQREALITPDNPLQLPAMAPGDTCIFDRNMLHRSLKNLTDENRFAYAAQFQAEHARLAATGKKDPDKMLLTDLRNTWLENGVASVS